MSYLALKHLHLGLAGLAIVLYLLRGIGLISGGGAFSGRIWRILPHAIYTALLAAGATLATMGGLWTEAWLWTKLALLAGFVVLGAMALKPTSALPKGRRIGLWGMGLVVFVMILAVMSWRHARLNAAVPLPASQTTPASGA